MGYKSVKDENFPKPWDVLRGEVRTPGAEAHGAGLAGRLPGLDLAGPQQRGDVRHPPGGKRGAAFPGEDKFI